MKSDRHQIVVSVENNPYSAWQAKLFYYSCLSRLEHHPLIVVHGSDEELQPDYREIVEAGGTIQQVPNYKLTPHGDEYPPRNTAGTLLHAYDICKGQADFIVLCDPDMIFIREPEFPTALSANQYSYLDYTRNEVIRASDALRIPPEDLSTRGRELKCGVPYVIPTADAQRLARGWLEALDAFPPRTWIDIMHAFGLAVMRLKMPFQLFQMVDLNSTREKRATREIIHYCYGDKAWNKRDFMTEVQVPLVWHTRIIAEPGTVMAELYSQIKEAHEFYPGSASCGAESPESLFSQLVFDAPEYLN